LGESSKKSRALVAIAGITVGLAACSSQPSTFIAQGSITSSTPASLGYTVGDKCSGMGNDSMQKGKEYKITAGGKTLAIGKLDDGVGVSGGAKGVICEFKFSQEVEAGLKFYTLDMGEFQGHKEFSEAEFSKGITIDRIDLDGRK
jgi:hypothetical protein